MSDDTEIREHPSDEALAVWVDARIGGEEELVRAGRRVADHLVECSACRARVLALESVVASLRAEPSPPPEAELARSRERVLAAIEPRTSALGARLRRWWWVPGAAAAALAVLLVARAPEERDGGDLARDRATRSAAEADTAPLAVVAAARAAADDALAVVPEGTPGTETVDGSTAVDPSTVEGIADAALGQVAVLDPSTAPLPGAILAETSLADEFTGLSADEQEAILDELASLDLQL